MTFSDEHTEPLPDNDLARRVDREQFAAHGRDAGLGRQHVDPSELHHLGNGATRRHAHPGPCRPVDRDATRRRAGTPEAGRHLAQQIVGCAVVGLTSVAETTGDGAERDRRTERHVTDRVQQVEPAVALDVEHEIELALAPCRAGSGSHQFRPRARSTSMRPCRCRISSTTAVTAAASVRSTLW